jgi:hypothetical protein
MTSDHLDSRRLLLLFYLVSLITGLVDLNQQQIIIEEPEDQQVNIGDQVTLKCRIENLRGEPQWCIDDFCLGVSHKDADTFSQSKGNEQLTLKGRPRHKIIGDKSKGEFHLLIEPVQLQDNMYYYCMTTAATENIKAVKSKKVFVTVLTYPQSLNLDNPALVSLNKPSQISCTARQSRPPVKILMAINGQLITDESKYKTEVFQIPIVQTNSEEEASLEIVKLLPTANIGMQDLRQSFYDTVTNLTIDDVTMSMQGQLVECFAYSFMNNFNSKISLNNKGFKKKNYFTKPVVDLNSFQKDVMNTKSNIQVNCNKFIYYFNLICIEYI